MAYSYASYALVAAALALGAGSVAAQQQAGKKGAERAASPERIEPTGFTSTPMIPGTKWHVHDDNRPRSAVVIPGTASTQEAPGKPPSDAVVLFDGKDLSHWVSAKTGGTAPWRVVDGAIEVVPYAGDIRTADSFGDCHIHVEWATPAEVKSNSQGRGNSGVYIMGKYEVEILDSFQNKSYADGQAGAIYGQYPPLVNPSRKPGEWQVFDIVFEAPKFQGDDLIKPAYVTVFYNGLPVQIHRPLQGPTVNKAVAHYTAHAGELPLMLQDHHNPVRFRNVWVRPLDFGEPDLTVADLKEPAAKGDGKADEKAK